MPALDQQDSLPRRVSIKNTFIDVIELEADGNVKVSMKSCPLAYFAPGLIASADVSPASGCASRCGNVPEPASSCEEMSVPVQSFLLGMSTRELQQTPCKVGGFPSGFSTPTGSQSMSGILSSLGHDVCQKPCKVEVPSIELPRSYIRVKNTFVEPCDVEKDCMKEGRIGLKTCPIFQFRNVDFLSSDQAPMKVELPSDFLDPVSVQAYEQMSEASTSAGSDSDQEIMQPDGAEEKVGTPPSDHPSKGSAFHEAGTCEPCAWFWKPEGCRWGQNCKRCHFCPQYETKVRRKQKQAAIRVRGA